MSSYEPSSPVSASAYDRDSIHGRAGTPDIIVEPDDETSFSRGVGFNLADELAAAEDEDIEHEVQDGTFLEPPQNRTSLFQSDYEGSEYGDIDDDSDGYLSDHVDVEEQDLNELINEYTGNNVRYGLVGRFVEEIRNMRGTIEVENNVRRYYLVLESLTKAN